MSILASIPRPIQALAGRLERDDSNLEIGELIQSYKAVAIIAMIIIVESGGPRLSERNGRTGFRWGLITHSKQWNFENRTECLESRAVEKNGPFGEY